MGPISQEIDIDASREEIFDFLCDLSLRPGWMGKLAGDYRLERIDPRGIGAGARFKPDGPGVEYMDTTIVETDFPEKIVERGEGGLRNKATVNTVWELIPGASGVTTVRVTFWTEQHLHLGRASEIGRSGWWKRRWKSALRGLRAAIESGELRGEPVEVAGGNRVPGAA
ncbi:MAG: SRPBCC family protein [bacterium]